MSIGSVSRLVLWDIDQTLIDGGEVTQVAYASAFHRVTRRRLEHPWQFDGRTELAAATEVLQAHGFDVDSNLLERFLAQICAEFQQRAADLKRQGRVLRGAHDALKAVDALCGMRQSVLTGNLYPLAVLKLRTFGLIDHVDLRVGAYGADAFERTDLPQHALARARNHLNRHFAGSEVTIIGDTRRDIAAAHAIGARAVGVATGTTIASELWAAGADIVLTDLGDTDQVVAAISQQ